MATTYTIILTDGTTISNLGRNEDYFVSSVEIDESIFDENLSNVVISDGTTEEVHEQMELLPIFQMDGKYLIGLIDVPMEEMRYAKNRADIDYLGMMVGVEFI